MVPLRVVVALYQFRNDKRRQCSDVVVRTLCSSQTAGSTLNNSFSELTFVPETTLLKKGLMAIARDVLWPVEFPQRSRRKLGCERVLTS